MTTRIEWSQSRGLGEPPGGLATEERLAVAANLDGHLEVFAVANDGAVWHVWETDFTSGQQAWSAWASLGTPAGVKFNGRVGFAISAKPNLDGRLEIFLFDDSFNIWHIWQAAPNVNWVTEWDNLGRPAIARGSSPLPPDYTMHVVNNESSKLEVFLRDVNNGTIWSKSQLQPNGNWESAWTNLGVPTLVGPPPVTRDFTVVLNVTVELELIALGSDDNLWHKVRPALPPGPWSGWKQMSAAPAGVSLSSLDDVKPNQDGRLELFCVALDGDIWHTWQAPGPGSNHWSGEWDNFHQPPDPIRGGFDVALQSDQTLFAASWGGDQTVYAVEQSAPNNGWSPWNVIRVSTNPNEFGIPELVIVAGADKLLNIFSRGLGDEIYYIPQTEVTD